MRRRSGFTLIEVMMVVAIIAILASIAIPAFQGYTLRAKANERHLLVRAMTESLLTRPDCLPTICLPGFTLLMTNPNPPGIPGPIKKPWNSADLTWTWYDGTPAGQVYYQYWAFGIDTPGFGMLVLSAQSDADGDGVFAVHQIFYSKHFFGGDVDWTHQPALDFDTPPDIY